MVQDLGDIIGFVGRIAAQDQSFHHLVGETPDSQVQVVDLPAGAVVQDGHALVHAPDVGHELGAVATSAPRLRPNFYQDDHTAVGTEKGVMGNPPLEQVQLGHALRGQPGAPAQRPQDGVHQRAAHGSFIAGDPSPVLPDAAPDMSGVKSQCITAVATVAGLSGVLMTWFLGVFHQAAACAEGPLTTGCGWRSALDIRVAFSFEGD